MRGGAVASLRTSRRLWRSPPRGCTTPALWGRLPSCRKDNKAEVGHPALPLICAAASPRCCSLRGAHQGEGGSPPHPASSRLPPPRRPPRCGIRRAPGFPLPHSGIEGIPAADGRIVRLEEAAASGRQKASCQPHRRHPCRRATAALVASSIEMAVRDGGSSSRVGLAGHGSRRLRPSRGQDRPPSTSLVRTRPLPARFPPGQAHNRSSTSRGTLSRSSPPQVV